LIAVSLLIQSPTVRVIGLLYLPTTFYHLPYQQHPSGRTDTAEQYTTVIPPFDIPCAHYRTTPHHSMRTSLCKIQHRLKTPSDHLAAQHGNIASYFWMCFEKSTISTSNSTQKHSHISRQPDVETIISHTANQRENTAIPHFSIPGEHTHTTRLPTAVALRLTAGRHLIAGTQKTYL